AGLTRAGVGSGAEDPVAGAGVAAERLDSDPELVGEDVDGACVDARRSGPDVERVGEDVDGACVDTGLVDFRAAATGVSSDAGSTTLACVVEAPSRWAR